MEMNRISIIREGSDMKSLEDAWSAEKTFIFLPKKGRVSDEWLREQLLEVPKSYSRDRFGLLTSGSTGNPKIIFSLKSRAERLSQVLHEIQHSENVQNTIVSLPLSYSFAFVNQWVWAREFERNLIVSEGLKYPEKLQKELERYDNSMICLVGAQVPLLLNNFREIEFEKVIRIHFAGGPFPQSHFDDLKLLFPNARIFNNFGCAEAMPRLTIRESFGGDMPNDVGPPIPGVKIRSDSGDEVEFLSDYRADGQITGGEFQKIEDSKWIKTGDLGKISTQGNLILIGRANSVFKRYGEKISLMQIAESVKKVWGKDLAIYRETDKSGEPGYVLVLSPKPQKSHLIGILGQFRKLFPRSHWPLRIESCKKIPKLPNGKEDVLALSSSPNKSEEWSQRI